MRRQWRTRSMPAAARPRATAKAETVREGSQLDHEAQFVAKTPQRFTADERAGAIGTRDGLRRSAGALQVLHRPVSLEEPPFDERPRRIEVVPASVAPELISGGRHT